MFHRGLDKRRFLCIMKATSNQQPATSNRKSNFEFLRLFAMFLIVFQHLFIPLIANTPALTNAFAVFVHIAVPCFVIISGYFGINATLKGFLNLYFKCMILGVGLYFSYCIFGNSNQFTIKEIIKAFMPFTHSGLWFVQTYVLLYIISPLVNKALNNATSHQKILFIIVTGVITFWFGWVNQNNTLTDGKNIVNFIFLYCIGNYIHYNIQFEKLAKMRYVFLFGYLFINIVLFSLLTFTGEHILFQKIVFKIFHPYNSPGVILNATLLFLFVSTLTIDSKSINWIADSVLAVYVIHANTYFLPFLARILLWIKNEIIGDIKFAILSVVTVIIIMFFCIFIDKIIKPIRMFLIYVIYYKLKLNKIDFIIKKVY
jgi:surface polysaccharide O-acyltransferase-like enzyme